MTSSRDEFPNEWIMLQGGDPNIDDGYVYVGTTGVYYKNPDTDELYHVGVTALGEIIGSWSPGGPGSIIYDEVRGLRMDEIPQAAKNKLASEGLLQIGTLSGNLILGALGIDLPTNIEPISFARIFNGTDEEKQAEQENRLQWQQAGEELRQQLGIE